MADTQHKRQNTAGKVPVATPNIGPTGMVSLETALTAAIGAKIRLQTVPPTSRTIEGTLFTVSPALNLLTLTASPTPATEASTYHILPISALQSFSLVSLPAPTASLPLLPPLDHSALQSRLESTIARLRAEEARKGKGVSREAQEIFDRISRTLPTRWEGKDIVVSDAVVIEAPYRPEDCKAGSGAAKESLTRVKKVLEIERKKLSEKAGPSRPVIPAAVPLTGPRKGG
ncbi:hypothetical protein MMC34_006752 [Xylographa carneopallida]|nr:hypothetical protein [Xylographa carneopallida]